MKTFKKILSVSLALLMILGCLCLPSFAIGEKIDVKLRVEGIKACLFYGSVEIDDSASVLDVLKAAPGIEVTASESEYGGEYVTAINGEKEKSFGGWDGWLYTVNGVESQESIDKQIVKNGDSVLVYYGDPYGVGFAYPTADTSKLADGKLSFTTTVTTYDENWNATEKVEPIKNYSIIWGYGDGKTVTITSDTNGVVSIAKEYLQKGEHSVQIEKYSPEGLPLVLRFAPDYTVTVGKKSVFDSIKDFFNKVLGYFKGIISKIVDFVKSIGVK